MSPMKSFGLHPGSAIAVLTKATRSKRKANLWRHFEQMTCCASLLRWYKHAMKVVRLRPSTNRCMSLTPTTFAY